ncbi:MAG: nitrogenase-stabilizing/protective protein NifW [Magnetovibrionaceae bacterium]
MLEDDMEDLSSAEDFLEYFEVPFEAAAVHVNRLHILQRFHDYLAGSEIPEEEAASYAHHKALLTKAYNDFIESDALTEKVFKVFHDAEEAQKNPQTAPSNFVALDDVVTG